MNSNNRTTTGFQQENAYIEINTLSGAFTVNETITGGTSSATGKVKSTAVGNVTLVMDTPSATAFTVGETITGGSSSATAVVTAYVPQIHTFSIGTISGQSHAILPKTQENNNQAQDFKPGAVIVEGSWVSCSLLNDGGAGDITIQLELESFGESMESRK
jgi:hypothetical protein